MDVCDLGKDAFDKAMERAVERRRENSVPAGQIMECIECGEEIPIKRIEAHPGCERCVMCQTRFEQGGRL